MRIMQFLAIMIVLAGLAGAVGCSSIPGMGGGEPQEPVAPAASPPPGGSIGNNEYGDVYYDFPDVLMPKEMKLESKESVVIETPSTKAGILAFNGKVERTSLTNFFINNMAKDKWTMRSAFKASRTVLIFEKPGRFCVINIEDGMYNTRLEVIVTPTSQGGYAPRPAQRESDAGQAPSAPQPQSPRPAIKLEPPVKSQGLEQ